MPTDPQHPLEPTPMMPPNNRIARKGAVAHAVRMMCEHLERRILLAAVPTPTLDADGVLSIRGTRRHDTVIVSRTDLGVDVAINGTVNSFTGVSSITASLLGGHDSLSVIETEELPLGVGLTVDGGGGNDALAGSLGDDHLLGGRGKGRDNLFGGGGNDTLEGGQGHDRLMGEAGDDKIVPGGGKNLYNGGGGNNTVEGASAQTKEADRARPLLEVKKPDQAVPLIQFGTVSGYLVDEVRAAYGFPFDDDLGSNPERGAGQGIAVIIPYQVPQLQNSVRIFANQFGLPTPNANNFQIINTRNPTPVNPDPNNGWASEAATDVEMIRAMVPEAKIYVVLAQSDLFPDLFDAVDRATDVLVANHGGGVVAMTFGSQFGELDPGVQRALDTSFQRPQSSLVSYFAGAGDVAALPSYPATSPFVTGVGGTSLTMQTVRGVVARSTEYAWASGGGGLSTVFGAPRYQTGDFPVGPNPTGIPIGEGPLNEDPTDEDFFPYRIGQPTFDEFGNIEDILPYDPQTPDARASPDVSLNADPAHGHAVYIHNTFGDIDGDGTQDSGWVPGGVGGTSVAAPIWASIAVLANARRIERGIGYIGDRMNYVLYDLGRNVPNEVYNDIISDFGTPIEGRPGSFPNGGSGRIYRDPDSRFGSPFPPTTDPPPPELPELEFPLFDAKWPFGWIHPAFVGFDLATGWGSPKVGPLLDRLELHSAAPLNIPALTFEAEFYEAITKTGPLASPGAGFANGIGSITSVSTLDPTSIVLSFTPTEQYNILITNFQVPVLQRKPDGRFSGFASANVTIELIAAGPGSAAPPPDEEGNPPPRPGDPNAPPGTPASVVIGTPSYPPIGGHEIRTWIFTDVISIVGRVYKSKSGREHVRGSFHNIGLGQGLVPGGEAQQGIHPVFRGKFKG